MKSPIQILEDHLQAQLSATIVGLQPVIRALAVAVIARGHVLVQGPPGLGKTLLARSLAAALGGTFKRIQGTADLMPADVTGVHLFDQVRNEFVFRPGPVFADVVLVDEVNRAGPKTQSALLEAMEERQVTIDRENFRLPDDFMVIATQNPREFEGTFPLPESQLDRFMLCIDLGYPDRDTEAEVLARYGTLQARPSLSDTQAALSREGIEAARTAADAILVAPELIRYVLDLAQASREHAHVALGLSTRGALALLRAARVMAGLRGADFASPDDVKAAVPLVVPHRLILAPEALLEAVSAADVAAKILEKVAVPR